MVRRRYAYCGSPTSSLQIVSRYLAQVSLFLNAHTHTTPPVLVEHGVSSLCLSRKFIAEFWTLSHRFPCACENRIFDPTLDSPCCMKDPNPQKGSGLRSGFLKPNMPVSIPTPQVLLRSFFLSSSSTWCSAFCSKEHGCRKTARKSWC